MTSDWNRLRELFDRAVELPPDARQQWLDRECATEPELRFRLETLLVAAAESDGRLEPPARVESAALPPIGTSIGGFRLQRMIAAGGMGVVFEAEQEKPRRTVAVKLLAGQCTTDAVRRFRREAELLGRLRHSGIAQVYATGVWSGDGGAAVPWLAMELVESACDLRTWCREKALTTRQTVELFLQVCDAVQHGHQHLVVHRDLKPLNVLVDATGTVKVIDFGIARAIDADALGTLANTSGGVVGTLQYLSPEQLDGDPDAIDARTDVHGLGVVLFELLTGELPYPVGEGSIVDALQEIRDRPPRRPSATALPVQGDLEQVLLKAIAKEPDRRYPSVTAFAADLRRFLGSEPVMARPPSTAYHARLFLRRNRVTVTAAAAVFVASLTATAISVVSAVRAEASRVEEQQARQEADTAQARTAEMFEDFLASTFEATFTLAERAYRLPGGAELAADLLARGAEDLQKLSADAGGDVGLGDEIVLAWARLGEVRGLLGSINTGEIARAGTTLEKAVDLADSLLLRAPDDVRTVRATSFATNKLAQWQLQVGRLDDAVHTAARALELILSLTKRRPDDVDLLLHASACRDISGRIATARGDVDFAGEHAAALTAVLERVLALDADNRTARIRMAMASASCADSDYRRGVAAEQGGDDAVAKRHYATSMAHSLTAVERLRAAIGDEPDVELSGRIAGQLRWAGAMALLCDRLDESERTLREALDELRLLALRDSEDTRVPPMIGDVLTSLGNVARTRAQRGGDDAARVRSWRAARSLYVEALGVWEGLEARGQLIGGQRAFPADVRERIAGCDAALGRL